MSAPIDPGSHASRAQEPEALREHAADAIVVLDPHEVRLRALPGPDGRTLVLGSLIDVAHRDAPYERLEAWHAREAKDPHAAFIASLHDGFEMIDRDGMILDVNERFAEIVGVPREEI